MTHTHPEMADYHGQPLFSMQEFLVWNCQTGGWIPDYLLVKVSHDQQQQQQASTRQ